MMKSLLSLVIHRMSNIKLSIIPSLKRLLSTGSQLMTVKLFMGSWLIRDTERLSDNT